MARARAGLPDRRKGDLPPQELLLSGQSEGVPDLSVRRAPVPGRPTRRTGRERQGGRDRPRPPGGGRGQSVHLGTAAEGRISGRARPLSTSTGPGRRSSRSAPAGHRKLCGGGAPVSPAAPPDRRRARDLGRRDGEGVAPVRRQRLRSARGVRRAADRTELKNLNSFAFAARAIEREVERQIGIYESGGEVEQETLHFDPVSPRRRCARRRRHRTTATSPSPISSRSTAGRAGRARPQRAPELPGADPPSRRRARSRRGGSRHEWARLALRAGAGGSAGGRERADEPVRGVGRRPGAVDADELGKLIEARSRIRAIGFSRRSGRAATQASRPTLTSATAWSRTPRSSSRSSTGSWRRTRLRSSPIEAARRAYSASSSARSCGRRRARPTRSRQPTPAGEAERRRRAWRKSGCAARPRCSPQERVAVAFVSHSIRARLRTPPGGEQRTRRRRLPPNPPSSRGSASEAACSKCSVTSSPALRTCSTIARRASTGSRRSIARRTASCCSTFSSSSGELCERAIQVRSRETADAGRRSSRSAARFRGVQNRLVEEVVRLHPDALVLPRSGAARAPRDQRRDRLPKQRLGLAQAKEVAVADPLCGELRRETLELGAHLVRLADLPREGPRTTAPRLGCTSSRPVACSWRSASRTGVRLTPNSSATPPGGGGSRRDFAAQHLGLDR